MTIRWIHRIRRGHWPQAIVANFIPYDCQICSAEEIARVRNSLIEIDREIAQWNMRAGYGDADSS